MTSTTLIGEDKPKNFREKFQVVIDLGENCNQSEIGEIANVLRGLTNKNCNMAWVYQLADIIERK